MTHRLAPDDLDDALVLATKRTASAQRQIDEILSEGIVPPDPLVSTAVDRAEDIEELARDAADEETDDDSVANPGD